MNLNQSTLKQWWAELKIEQKIINGPQLAFNLINKDNKQTVLIFGILEKFINDNDIPLNRTDIIEFKLPDNKYSVIRAFESYITFLNDDKHEGEFMDEMICLHNLIKRIRGDPDTPEE